MHYKQISKGHFEWINVGEFHDGEMELRMEGKNYGHLNSIEVGPN